jgi:hypothetical protein
MRFITPIILVVLLAITSLVFLPGYGSRPPVAMVSGVVDLMGGPGGRPASRPTPHPYPRRLLSPAPRDSPASNPPFPQAAFAATVSFTFTAGQSVPQLPYLTRLDKFFLLCFFVEFALGVSSNTAYLVYERLKKAIEEVGGFGVTKAAPGGCRRNGGRARM